MSERTLKFRAWSKRHKIMHTKVNLYSLNSQGEMNRAQLDNKQIMENIGGSCEVMQFTGLIDMNNKEVFESDILEYTYHIPANGSETLRGEVVYNEGRACWAIEVLDGEYHYFGQHLFKATSKIIGNIYETPHLLNQ